MRSFATQVILVICMIIAAVLAVRYWNAQLPKIDLNLELPPISSYQDRDDSQKMIRVVCPVSDMEDPTAEPTWTVPPRPTEYDYPAGALQEGVAGWARVVCRAMPDGMVKDCEVAEEAPAGYGFGESAIKIAQRGCLSTFSPEDGSKSFTVRVPFNLY